MVPDCAVAVALCAVAVALCAVAEGLAVWVLTAAVAEAWAVAVISAISVPFGVDVAGNVGAGVACKGLTRTTWSRKIGL